MIFYITCNKEIIQIDFLRLFIFLFTMNCIQDCLKQFLQIISFIFFHAFLLPIASKSFYLICFFFNYWETFIFLFSFSFFIFQIFCIHFLCDFFLFLRRAYTMKFFYVYTAAKCQWNFSICSHESVSEEKKFTRFLIKIFSSEIHFTNQRSNLYWKWCKWLMWGEHKRRNEWKFQNIHMKRKQKNQKDQLMKEN